jgi:hypothetical protein
MARRPRTVQAAPAQPPEELVRFDAERWTAPGDDVGQLADAFGRAFMRGVMARGRWSTARLAWASEHGLRRFPATTHDEVTSDAPVTTSTKTRSNR